MNVLCIGDIVGRPGREALEHCLDKIKEEYQVDFTIVNSENAAGGAGLTSRIAKKFLKFGCDVLTLGDHTWDQKELEEYLEDSERVIRPANFPEGAPGRGWCVQTSQSGVKVGVINLLGRTFMRHQVECPFRAVKAIAEEIRQQTPVIILDMHAETTSEKMAMGHFCNGMVSAVYGTHTHIQTADETVLDRGTAYITDVGMSGPYDSVIGQNTENIIERFLSSRPIRFQVAEQNIKICGVVVSIDEASGQASKIQRIQYPYQPQS